MTIVQTGDFTKNFSEYCLEASHGEVYLVRRPKHRDIVVLSKESYAELFALAKRQCKEKRISSKIIDEQEI